MKLFYADHFVLPLPAGHRFPMEKYARLRERSTIASDHGKPIRRTSAGARLPRITRCR